MVNRRIFVVGFGLYGSIHGPSEYSVNIQVRMGVTDIARCVVRASLMTELAECCSHLLWLPFTPLVKAKTFICFIRCEIISTETTHLDTVTKISLKTLSFSTFVHISDHPH